MTVTKANMISARMQRGALKLTGVEAARGVAALLVVLVHASVMLSEPKYFGRMPFYGLFRFGHAGVDFFFVLSGFIIYYVHHWDIDTPLRVPAYYWKRFVRIYPSYWVVTAIWGIILIFSPTRDRLEQQFSTMIASALLLPLPQAPILDVAWTLRHELLFYTLFGALLYKKRFGQLIFSIWGLLIGANIAFACLERGTLFEGVAGDVIFRLFNMEFFCGMLIGYFVIHKERYYPRAMLIGGIVVFFGSGLLENWGPDLGSFWPPAIRAEWPPKHFGYAVGAAMALYGLVCTEESGWLRVPPCLKALGTASYSIYLVHTIVIMILQQVLLRTRHLVPVQLELTFMAFVAFCILNGVIFSRIVEQPLLRHLRGQTRTLNTIEQQAVSYAGRRGG